MRIVIVGDGKVGYSLSERLSREGHDIVVIDNNSAVLEDSLETLDIMVVEGNGASLEVQRAAGVADSDILIAATSEDETNLLCCIVAKKLGCSRTIARVRNPEYSQQLMFLKEELGLSLTVNPELAAAQEIYRMLQFPSFLKRDSFAKGRVELVEIKIAQGGRLDGLMLQNLYDTLRMRIIVCAVERGDEVIIPRGDFTLKAGDKITVTAERSSLVSLIKNLGLIAQKIKGCMIIGGGRIAQYLTEELLKSGVDVKLIEKDRSRCEQLSLCFPNALIIHGDASRRELLTAEGIAYTDAVITLTDMDEENLVISMFADHMRVPKTITKINRTEYAGLFGDKGIGSVVCPKELTTNEIIRYVRAMSNSGSGSVITLHRIVDGKAEALEFLATETTKGLNTPLSKLNIKKGVLISCINHAGKIIFPCGDDIIRKGDTVIVVTVADYPIYDLNDIFEREAVAE